MDLLTVVMHELGHVLGQDSRFGGAPSDLMAAYLATGERRLPGTSGVPSAAAVDGTNNRPSMPATSSTSVTSSGSSMSATDQMFANYTLVLNEMRNGNPPALSSVAALRQSIDALALQRLDLFLSMEAGAMGVTKDTLMRDLFFVSNSSSNGV
jgi:hypothetical protein